MVTSTLGFFFISLFFGIEMSRVDEYPLLSVVIMFLGCGLSLSNLLLLRVTKTTVIPGALLCIETLGIQAFQAYNDLGLNDPVLIWMLVIPWLAAFLVGPSFGFWFAGLVVAVQSGFYVLELQGHVFPNFTGSEEYWLFYLLETSSLALFLGFLGWIYEGQTVKNLREANLDLAAAHADLKQSNQRTERILESITDGFFSLNASWQFTDLNRQAEHFLGKSKLELRGRDARAFFTGTVGNEIRAKLRTAAAQGIPVDFELYYLPLKRWFFVHVYPFDEELSVYFSDISERKEYERRLIVAKEKAEELAQLKSTLLANMSHEIRTPLTAVIGFSSILAQEAALGEHKEFALLIGQNGQRLMDTLNSVLDLAQLERGALELNLDFVELTEEIEQVVQLLSPLAREQGLYLRMKRTAEDTAAALDRTMLNRILNNLIGNAIKFTNEGGVVVTTGVDGDRVWARVEDTGIGISPDFFPYLFDEFRQESTGLARAYEGNGLGLAISHRLIQTMDGTIDVQSEKGVGSTFTVRFPRRLPPSTKALHPHG